VVREFLLKSGDSAGYLEKLTRSESEVSQSLDEIGRMDLFAPAAPAARKQFAEHFAMLRELAMWSREKRAREGADFLSERYARLRAPGNRVLRDLAEASQNGRRRMAAEAVAGRMATLHRILILLGADLLLALSVAGLNLFYARELGRESYSKMTEIVRAKSAMQQLSARLLTIQEEERHRLSRDLHDGIGQLLTALRIEISHLGHSAEITEPDRERLRRARALAEEAVRHTRDIALILRPSHLDDLGLEAALQWQAEDFSRRTGIDCRFAPSGLKDSLPDAWKTCIYRIVQEALHNCEKHAAPKHVYVRVRQDSTSLALEFQDDGVGFELDAKGSPLRSAGLGLLGMRERAAMLGGALSICSAPGRGTTIRVELPVVRMLPALSDPAAADSPIREVKA
jgi:signal transduction histidine kinase